MGVVSQISNVTRNLLGVMETCRHMWRSINICWVYFLPIIFILGAEAQAAPPSRVQLRIESRYVVIDNGIITLTLLNPEGIVAGIQYNGLDNLMDVQARETNRGYWDINWNDPNQSSGFFDIIKGTDLGVIRNDEEQVEVSFTRKWDSSSISSRVPLNIDKRFVVLRGSSGFYSYAIYERLQGWPGCGLAQTRLTIKLRREKFRYLVVDDTRHRLMPTMEDREAPRARPLAYKEAVLLVNPTDANLTGMVDDKYQFSVENKDAHVHGWICSDPAIGFWQIYPSHEFRSGGPMKQELTSHTGPITLAIFQTMHYAGKPMIPNFQDGEPWKKVYGPVFFYLNKVEDHGVAPFPSLWKDAKRQTKKEVKRWPYSFPASADFPQAHERGAVHGCLHVLDRYFNGSAKVPATSAYVGLAPPGEPGSWQTESKGYQFWTRAGANGSFSIRNVREGTYNLYAFVRGYIGDYRYSAPITITAGDEKLLGDLVYEPPRNGPTLWEIGVPDRKVLEFFIPDPDPMYFNSFLTSPKNRIRQYGLWDRYTELYPDEDPVYTVGTSDYGTDWFYAHVPRKVGEGRYVPTTRRIRFDVSSIRTGIYTLRVCVASAQLSQLQIRLNNATGDPIFSSPITGSDNAIARHGLHGLQELYSIKVQSSLLIPGMNTLFFTQTRTVNPFQGILYDYIRLEGPPP